MTQIIKFALADHRIMFFNSETTVYQSVKLTYSALPGHVSQVLTPIGCDFYFNHEDGRREFVGSMWQVYAGQHIYTAPEHL